MASKNLQQKQPNLVGCTVYSICTIMSVLLLSQIECLKLKLKLKDSHYSAVLSQALRSNFYIFQFTVCVNNMVVLMF